MIRRALPGGAVLGSLVLGSLALPLLSPAPRLYGGANDGRCQICHPGPSRGLRATAHASLVLDPTTAEQACTVCHGDLTGHRAAAERMDVPLPPVPPVPALACASCHGEERPPALAAHPRPRGTRSGSGDPLPGGLPPDGDLPDPALAEAGTGLDWSGLWTLGYRFVSRSGSGGRYRTDLNLDPGLRLLETEIAGRGGEASWADRVLLRLDGLEDPYTDARFEVDRTRSYRALASYSRSEVIYDASGDFHRVDRQSERTTAQGAVQVGGDLELFGSFSRLERDSLWLTNRVGDQNLFPLTTVDDVTSPRRLQSDLADLGLSWNGGATALSAALEYLDETTVDRWSYQRPAQADPTFTETEDFTSASTVRGPGVRAALTTGSGTSGAGAWSLDFSGRFVDLDRQVNGAGRTTGFNFDEFFTDTTSVSEGGASTLLLDGTLTVEVADRAALVFDLRYLDHDERMVLDQDSLTTFPNLGLSVPEAVDLVNETDQERVSGSAQVDFSPQRGLDLSLGYGFSREDLRVPDLDTVDSDFLAGEIDDHGLLAGIRWRPDEVWTLRAYFQDFRQSGAQVHELMGDDAHRLDTSLAWQGPGYRVEAFYKRRQADNDDSLYRLDSHAVGATGSVNREGIDLFASYVFSDVDSRVLTSFYFDPDPDPVPTFVGFAGQTHTVAAGLSARPGARTRWQLDLSYTDTSGSFDVSLLDWRAELGVSVWTGGELGIRFREVDYQDQQGIDDYDADLVFIYWRQILGAR